MNFISVSGMILGTERQSTWNLLNGNKKNPGDQLDEQQTLTSEINNEKKEKQTEILQGA